MKSVSILKYHGNRENLLLTKIYKQVTFPF